MNTPDKVEEIEYETSDALIDGSVRKDNYCLVCNKTTNPHDCADLVVKLDPKDEHQCCDSYKERTEENIKFNQP